MNDIEDRLRRYRPADAPASLRARVVGAAQPGGAGHGVRTAWWAWVPAAAAAAIAILFYTLSASASASVAERLDTGDRARAAAVADLATQLGGDALAKFEAERSIDTQDIRDSALGAADTAQVFRND